MKIPGLIASRISQVNQEDQEPVLIETGSGGEIKELVTQAEPEGEEFPIVDEHNENGNALIHEPSVSQQGTSSQSIDLTDGDDAFTSPPLRRSNRDKHMSLQAMESYQTKD
eukprot:12486328-Ditylum_brightwellii.AAC.1